MQQDEIIIHRPQLTRAFRRQLRVWTWLFLPLFGLLLLPALFLVPLSYTSTVSVAIQQPSSGGSALALLAGGSAPSKRYIGVLKSREQAEFVESRVHLRDLYGPKKLPTESDAVLLLMKSVKPEDNAADGLLYVNVTLPGPPKLALTPAPTQAQIVQAAALAANSYALGLKTYYVRNDTDQSSVLLRQADLEVHQARKGYNEAQDQILNFSRGLSRVDPRSAPSASPSAGGSDSPAAGVSGDAAVAVAGMSSLYSQLGQVQTELRAAQAIRESGDALTTEQLRFLSRVPADDPLLINIRNIVKQDQANYDTFSSLYGPENPSVISAGKKLTIDQNELRRQVQGVKSRLTTPSIHSDQQIQGLYARQKSLLVQIAAAERRLGVHRQLSGELVRLQAEVAIRLEVLKTVMSEAEKVKVNNASALSRMSVIDSALPPKKGTPGTTELAGVCLALVLLAFGVAVVREYLKLLDAERAATPALEHLPDDYSANGSGATPLAEPEMPAGRLTTRER